VASESLEGVFTHEHIYAGYPTEGKGAVSKYEVEEAQIFVNSIAEAIEEWNESHKHETSLKNPVEVQLEEKQMKLIEYLQSLISSYKRSKESKMTEDDMLYTVRQMEVALHILNKQLGVEKN
jgi:hypothetical protein